MIGELYPGEFEAMEHNGRMDALEQEPCDVFDEYGNYKYPSDVELTEPNTATSMPCEDAISRQAAIDALGEKPLAWVEGEYELGLQNQWENDVDAIKTLLPAQPKTGHWITQWNPAHQKEYYYCSQCREEYSYDGETGIKMNDYNY
ncbi:MAG: hypothetical protein UHM23_08505, partial [Clostridia bacterium]|nr:hypothetical protein [Clostridia bacterium]